MPVRQTSPFSFFFGLPGDAVPPGCLTAINDPNRTMLGPVQKAKLKNDLLSSTATHKLIISELAWQQFYALPYDRWEGYAAERSEMLNFIRNNGLSLALFGLFFEGVIGLSGEPFLVGSALLPIALIGAGGLLLLWGLLRTRRA